jgi:hypothetical protein
MPPKRAPSERVNKCTKKGWDCKLCQKNFTNDTDRLMECEFCHEKYCIECMDISVDVYNILSVSDSMWFCPPCRVKVQKNIVVEKEIEAKCKEYMNKYENRLLEVENKLKTKCDADQVREIISEEISKINKQTQERLETAPAVANPPVDLVVDTVVKELRERESRDCNLIVYNLPEEETNLKEERLKTDIVKLTSLIKETLLEPLDVEKDVTKIIRLGKKIENRTRPLLVTFKKEDKKVKILSVGYRLKDAEAPFEKCAITYDRTFQERKILKEKSREAREKTIESAGKYMYKVRGPPWDLKIKRFDM